MTWTLHLLKQLMPRPGEFRVALKLVPSLGSSTANPLKVRGPVHLLKGLSSREPFQKIVIDTGHGKIWFALKRLFEIARTRSIAFDFDKSQDEVVWLVESSEDLRFGNCNGLRAGGFPLHLDEEKTTRFGVS